MDSRYNDRKTLKSYFKRGDIPTEWQFAELIDSVPNIHDDGLVKISLSDGIRLFPSGETGVLATIFDSDPDKTGVAPLWRLILDGENGLNIQDGRGETVMAIDRDKNITIGGTVKAGKFISDKEEEAPGTETLKVEADGYWHNLPIDAESGQGSKVCRVYRISACYLNNTTGEYSTCEAVASHFDGGRCKVGSQRKHWWGWSGRIKIRWKQVDGWLCLQIKSKGIPGGSEAIYCLIDTIWTL